MPRRDSDVGMVHCPISPRERAALDEIKAQLGIRSDANLVRTALYKLAQWCEVNVDTGLFRLRDASHRHPCTLTPTDAGPRQLVLPSPELEAFVCGGRR